MDEIAARLVAEGYTFLPAAEVGSRLQVNLEQLEPLRASWNDLPRDEYLKDGGKYRSRRHSCFIQEFSRSAPIASAAPVPAPAAQSSLSATPRRAHWQPTSYNALHGGIERWFEPIEPKVLDSKAWQQLVSSIGSVFARVRPVDKWFIEAHQFRIDTAGGIGRPTPEGAHRDGVDFVALMLVRRSNIRGGETRVFEANGISGVRFTMQEPWSLLLMDDANVIHETTPIQPDDGEGVRDTLVLTYRAGGFQAPGGKPSDGDPSIQVSSTRS